MTGSLRASRFSRVSRTVVLVAILSGISAAPAQAQHTYGDTLTTLMKPLINLPALVVAGETFVWPDPGEILRRIEEVLLGHAPLADADDTTRCIELARRLANALPHTESPEARIDLVFCRICVAR